jgi:hypothetical protein
MVREISLIRHSTQSQRLLIAFYNLEQQLHKSLITFSLLFSLILTQHKCSHNSITISSYCKMSILSTLRFWSTWMAWMLKRWSSNLHVMFLSLFIELCLVGGVYIDCPLLTSCWNPITVSTNPPEFVSLHKMLELIGHVRWALNKPRQLDVSVCHCRQLSHCVPESHLEGENRQNLKF